MISIAMTCSRYGTADGVQTRYWEALVRYGQRCGIEVSPIVLPMCTEENYLAWCASQFDGFLFTGGADMDPVLYGESNANGWSADINMARDTLECRLGRMLAENGKPTLGICRGIQSMNVAIGGSLWQDIHSQCCLTEHCPKNADGKPCHTVHVCGRLAELLGTTSIETNSYHHQSVKCVPQNAEILAHAADSVTEAFALKKEKHPYFVGFQWHPEIDPDDISEKLFVDFLKTVQANAQ